MRKYCSTFIFLFAFSLFSFGQEKQPQLVVGIVVDQMRADYLTSFWDNFGNDGFKRLVKEGYQFKNANYNYKPTYTGPGHASIYTGTTPSVHGIVGNHWYNRTLKKTVYCVESRDSAGNQLFSPSRLKSNTLADEIKKASNFKSRTYAVALKDRAAILPAGFLADGAYWFDEKKGSWISSSFYKESNPTWLQKFNAQDFQKEYLQNDWVLSLPKSKYTASLADDNPYEGKLYKNGPSVFPFDFQAAFQTLSFGIFNTIPQGNQMTVDIAERLIISEKLGQKENVDFLGISFSATDYMGHRFGINSMEVEDTYIKLDESIANLLIFLDQKVGEGNYLLFLTSDHGAGAPRNYLIDKGENGGYLDAKKIKKELDSALNKRFGEADWIEAFRNYNLYFNHQTLQEQGVQLADLLTFSTHFLIKEEGIADVYYSGRTMANSQYQKMIQNGIYPKNSGDLVILEEPNWNTTSSTGSTHGSPYRYDTHVPLLFFGKGIKAGSTHRECSITDIIPSISTLLNIPQPDGATGKVLFEICPNNN